MDPGSRGDPISPLRWTGKSVRRLATELTEIGHAIGPSLVARLLHQLGYSLQANRKVIEGSAHPDRSAKFEQINASAAARLAAGEAVIGVDTKKKELVGWFKNGGKERRPKGDPEHVRVHDVKIEKRGRANPW